MPASAKAVGAAARKAREEVQLSRNDRDDDYRRLDNPTEAEQLDRPCSRLGASFAGSAGGAQPSGIVSLAALIECRNEPEGRLGRASS